MAYARFGSDDSSVYVIKSIYGDYECIGCDLERGFHCEEPEEMIGHLQKHWDVGDVVPDNAFVRLKNDTRHEH